MPKIYCNKRENQGMVCDMELSNKDIQMSKGSVVDIFPKKMKDML